MIINEISYRGRPIKTVKGIQFRAGDLIWLEEKHQFCVVDVNYFLDKPKPGRILAKVRVEIGLVARERIKNESEKKPKGASKTVTIRGDYAPSEET